MVYATCPFLCNRLVAKQSSRLFAENGVPPLNPTDMRRDRQEETDDDDEIIRPALTRHAEKLRLKEKRIHVKF